MINDLINEYCTKYKLDTIFMNALIQTESAFNPLAIRYEEDYRYLYKLIATRELVPGSTLNTITNMQKTSWGLCQILGAVYYELGGKNWATCLLDPRINISYGCQLVRKLIDSQHLERPVDIYSAYNAGSVKHMKSGKLVNQHNVDRFMSNYNSIREM